MSDVTIIEERPYKGWTILVCKKQRNFARPFFARIVAPDGNTRHVSRTQAGQASIVYKEVTYSTILAARHAGFTAVNHYESRSHRPVSVEKSNEELLENILSIYGKYQKT